MLGVGVVNKNPNAVVFMVHWREMGKKISNREGMIWYSGENKAQKEEGTLEVAVLIRVVWKGLREEVTFE